MNKASIISALIFHLTFPLEVSGQDWELKKDADGIRVYTKMSNSSYKMFRAEMMIHASIDGCILLLKDDAHIPEWMDKVSDYSMPSVKDEFHWTAWSGIEMPWPVDDRDVVTSQVLEKTSTGYVIRMVSDPDLTPLKEEYVRLIDSKGYWAFEQEESGKIKITYEFLTIPEGIPSWVVNLFIVDAPYRTLRNMREMIKKEPYKSVKLDYLE